MAVKTTELIPGGSRKKKEEEKQTSPVFKNAWQIMQEAKQAEKQEAVKPYESPVSLLQVPETKYEPEKYHKGDYFLDTSQWIQVSERNKMIREYNEARRNNITYLPNSHVEEINQNMMEQGLHPVFTSKSYARPRDEQEKYAARERILGRERDRWQSAYDDEEKKNEYERNRLELIDLQQQYDDSLKPGHPKYSENKKKGERIQELIRLVDGYELEQAETKKRLEYLDGQLRIVSDYAKVAALPQDVQELLERIADADDVSESHRFDRPSKGNGVGNQHVPTFDTTLLQPMENASNARQQLLAMGYSIDEIDTMYKAYKNVHNDRIADERKMEYKAAADEAPIINSFGSVIAGLGGGVSGAIGMFAKPGERNNPIYTGASLYANTTQETVRANIENSVREKIDDPDVANFFAKAAGYGYAGATSAAQSALAMGLGSAAGAPWLGEVLLGAGAASQTYNDMLIKFPG